MSFTVFNDDDLNLVKSNVVEDERDFTPVEFPNNKIYALLARLDAAEAVIERMAPPLRMMKLPQYDAWLKSAGKPQGEGGR